MPPTPFIEPSAIDTSCVLFDRDAIRRGNPQRFEMEHLSAVVHLDTQARLIVGYKDISADEFWARGHMPNYPLMPGVLVCEAAAQLCSFYCHVIRPVSDSFLGFGGMEGVRFRGQVRPGDRLVIVGKGEQIRRRRMEFDTQAFVGSRMVYHGRIIGFPLNSVATG